MLSAVSRSDNLSEAAGAAVLCAFVFLGFRIWEIIDVWTLPSSHNNEVRSLEKWKQNQGNQKSGMLQISPIVMTYQDHQPSAHFG